MIEDWIRRLYVPKEGYPDGKRRTTAKEKWSAVTTANPDQAEFTSDIPDEDSNARTTELLKQSEHKKPYASKGYGPMEYELEPPPGFGPELPPGWQPPPGVTYPGTPTFDGETGGGPSLTIFDIEPEALFSTNDPQASRGPVCPGTWTLFDLNPTHPVDNVQLLFAPAGAKIRYPSSDRRFVEIFLLGNAFGGLLRIRANMTSAAGVSGDSVANIEIGANKDVRCPSIYADVQVRVNVGFTTYTRHFVWDFWRETIPANIPDGLGGTVSMPCTNAALTYWRSQVPSIPGKSAKRGRDCTMAPDPIPTCDIGLNGIGDDYSNVVYYRCGGSQFYDSKTDCEVICSFCNPAPPPASNGTCITTRRRRYPLLTAGGIGSGTWKYGYETDEGTYDEVLMYDVKETWFEQNTEIGGVCVDTGIQVLLQTDIEWYSDVDGESTGTGTEPSDRVFAGVSMVGEPLVTDYINPELEDHPENPDAIIFTEIQTIRVNDIGGGGIPTFYENCFGYVDYDHTGFVLNDGVNTKINRGVTGSDESDISDMLDDIIAEAKTAWPMFTSISVTFLTQFRQGTYE